MTRPISTDRSLQVIHTPEALRRSLAAVRRGGQAIGAVFTMGALHEGHLSLVRAARRDCDFVVATIYVNPTQFGPHEDFARYPRPLEQDLALLRRYEADLVFVPSDADMYPPGFATLVDVGPVAARWEGEIRPGHFRGVATVVLKLLNLTGPDAAYFGQKDYQQLQVIRQLVRDLNLPVEVRMCPIVREPDGLACSSRNAYLSAEGRRRAPGLWASLRQAEKLVAAGTTSSRSIEDAMRQVLLAAGLDQIDYVVLADPASLEPVPEVRGPTVALVAARVEGTRLIDNHLLDPTGKT